MAPLDIGETPVRYSWDEIDQLAELLEAEVNGLPINADEIYRLAASVAMDCPEIVASMHRVMHRMDLRRNMAA